MIGYDLDKLSIDRAKENGKNFENVFFECDDVCNFHPQGVPKAERFDLVTFLLCLHDLRLNLRQLTSSVLMINQMIYQFSVNINILVIPRNL